MVWKGVAGAKPSSTGPWRLARTAEILAANVFFNNTKLL